MPHGVVVVAFCDFLTCCSSVSDRDQKKKIDTYEKQRWSHISYTIMCPCSGVALIDDNGREFGWASPDSGFKIKKFS